MKTEAQISFKGKSALPDHPLTFMKGCNALVVGNMLKAGTRFFIFNSTSKFMSNDVGKTTAPRVVVAGLMTGFVESLWVIPFENIKTTIIQNVMLGQVTPDKAHHHDKSAANPLLKTQKRHDVHYDPQRLKAITHYNSNPSTTFTTAVREILATRGVGGFFQASGVTLLRQTMNSVVWFSTYHSLKQLFDPSRSAVMPPSDVVTLSLSMVSSLAVVGVTQPIDVVKTRMQTKDYATKHRDSMRCLFKTIVHEGFSKLWSGWFPRLIKVSASGSITLWSFTMFQNGVNRAMSERPFSAE